MAESNPRPPFLGAPILDASTLGARVGVSENNGFRPSLADSRLAVTAQAVSARAIFHSRAAWHTLLARTLTTHQMARA